MIYKVTCKFGFRDKRRWSFTSKAEAEELLASLTAEGRKPKLVKKSENFLLWGAVVLRLALGMLGASG